MDFDKYYKTSKKLNLRKYARQVPDLTTKYYKYVLNMDQYDKEANCTIFLRYVDYNSFFITDSKAREIYAPSKFNDATVTLAYNPYKDYMFEVWDDIIFLKGKQVGRMNREVISYSGGGYHSYKKLKFFDPFLKTKKHHLALISNKKLNYYLKTLNKQIDILINDYVEFYPSSEFNDQRESNEFSKKYKNWTGDYNDSLLQRDLNDKVLEKFIDVKSLKSFLIKKSLVSKKISPDEDIVDLIEDYFVRTHIMKIGDIYYIDFYDLLQPGRIYENPSEL